MRKGFFYGILSVLSFSLMSAMCSSDDDGSQSDNSAQIAQIENTVEAGTWRITNFVDSGQDETNDFSGYEFTFASNGTLTATNGTTSYSGTWSVTSDDDSSDDDSSDDDGSSSNDDLDFNISFPVPDSNDFEDLNDDWDIVSYSDTVINLIDISGGNGDTDVLTFERN
jgi:hypothetical protein